MARNRRSYSRPSRPRRRYEWARSDIGLTWTTANLATQFDLLDDFQQVLGADAAGTTITRIRGRLLVYCRSDTELAPQPLHVGIRVATEPPEGGFDDVQQEFFANQKYADWMYYDELFAPVSGTTDPVGMTFTEYVIDIKSQRRFDELQQSLYLFGASSSVPEDGSVNILGSLNVLLKMP